LVVEKVVIDHIDPGQHGNILASGGVGEFGISLEDWV
jgi:hypothetical protein